MQELPTGSVDMILCDLPYGTTRNGWDSLIPLKPLWDEYLRVVKERGAIVLTAQGLFTARLMTSCEEHFKYKIVWMKSKATNFLNAKRQPLRKHEDICVFYQKAPTYNPQMSEGDPYDKGVRKDQLTGSYGDFDPAHVKSEGQRYPTDVVYFKTAESEGEVWHPTQKPVALGRYLVRTFTNPGDVVLDNAFGSGSFLVASLLEGRHFTVLEKNDQLKRFKGNEIDCIDLARKRLEEAKERLARTGESPQDISVDASEETSYEPSGQTMSLFQDVEVREVNFDDDSWQ
jgi:site-specific DNA-methyltransferase (adenine-specific)/modification methylase